MRRRLWFRQWFWTSLGTQLAITTSPVDASPLPLALGRRQSGHTQDSDSTTRRNDSQDLSNDIAPQVWVPAMVVCLVLMGAFFFVYTRTSVLSRFRQAAVRAMQSSNTTTPSGNFTGTGTREVTAQQLTGVGRNTASANANTNTNRNGSNNGNGGAGRTNPRTGRRNRRTPSQMSTHSLPVYMKEPGDQELVIFTGPEAVDVDVSIAEAREAEEREDGRDSESLRREVSRDSAVVSDPVARVREASGGEPLGPGPRPDQSAMSLGLSEVGVGAEREHDADTSTVQLLPQRFSVSSPLHGLQERRDSRASSNIADEGSALMQRRASITPSEAPPDYESSSAAAENSLHNASGGDSTRGRDSVSTTTHGIDPPGLSLQSSSPTGPSSNESYPPSSSSPASPSISFPSLPSPRSSRLVGVGDRRSRLASRVSQFLNLRNVANVNSANAVNEGENGEGRSPDGVELGRGPGLPRASGSRMDSRASNVISLNELPSDSSSPSTQQSQGQGLGQRIPHQQQSHRHSNSSTSTSAFHLPLRTISRQRSSNTLSSAFGSRSNLNLNSLGHSPSNSVPNANATIPGNTNSIILTSPSTLSLAQSIMAGQTAISSPLPHTLVRTEIRYPAGGPTPEQLKLLSSREGLGRFAVPYGESAVEFARSSRLELGEEPPPSVVFEGDETGEERDERRREEIDDGNDGDGDSDGSNLGDNVRREREGERRNEDRDETNDDPDALPSHFQTSSGSSGSTTTPTSTSEPSHTHTQTHTRDRSVENVPVREARVLLPLFL